jgi:cytochrome P450
VRLNHGIDQDGDPADCFDYHNDGATCPVFTVNGREIILLRTWRAALEGLRNPYLRDLAAIEPDAAIAGITRERPGGLLRRSGPDTSIRTALNPLFAPPAVERWRPGLRALARRRARELPAEADLIRDFCAPLAGDLACLTAGLQPAEWDRLNCLGVRANALVLGGHQDIDLARAELHDFCAPLVERSRHEDHLLSACVRVMDEHGMPPGEVVDACTTIYGGYASVLPTLTVIVYETVSRPDVMRLCHREPRLLHHVIWEHLRRNAHFTFALPGRCMRDTQVGKLFIPEGANVLPVIRAAHRDPAHDPDPGAFDLGRPHRAILAFGAGVHVCPGKALTLMFLAEAMVALVGLPGLRMAARTVSWKPGLMPVPGEIPVTIRKD